MPEFYFWLAFKWLLAVYTCYRLARLVSQDALTDGLRRAVGRRAVGRPHNHPWIVLAEWLYCAHCSGVWFAAALAWLIGANSLREFILFWLSIAGAQSWLESRSVK